MKKKPVKRRALGGVLLDKMTDGAIKAPIGIIPQLMYQRNKDRKAAAMPMPEEGTAPTTGSGMQRPELPTRGMKKGGKVRGDGICQRGKTKGTMR